MALKRLKGLKKESPDTIQKQFVRHLVVGEDLPSASLYRQLVEKYGEDEVLWVCAVEPTLNELRPWGPTSLRGEANLDQFKRSFESAELTLQENEPVFFKEQKFRQFSGKMKPEPLQWGEEFYSQKGAHVKWEQVFPFLNDQMFMNGLLEKVEAANLTGIHKVNPNDLIESAEYTLSSTDGKEYQCQSLYWGRSPIEFLHLFQDKNALSADFIQFCEESMTPCSLIVRLVFNQKLSDRFETIFLPLSYTHEWGHWMGEFGDYKDGQEVEFLTFFDKNSTSEDELSKKIRLLKRQLEKIFSSFKNCPYDEFIKVEDHALCLKFDEDAYQKIRGELKNLQMFSVNGPLERFNANESSFEYSTNNITHLMRALKRGQFLSDHL